MKTKINVRYISRVGLLVAMFVVLAMAVQVPVFENYYICLGYFAMLVGLVDMGVAAGTICGTAGVFLYCLITSGMRGMPGWLIGNLVIGLILGFSIKATKDISKPAKYVVNSVVIVLSTLLGILVCKSAVEHFLYAQPMAVRMAKNIYATVADIVVMIALFPVANELSEAVRKYMHGPSDAEATSTK